MLARPEPGTREDILLWIAGKRGYYHWGDPCNCAVAQYAKERLGLEATHLTGSTPRNVWAPINMTRTLHSLNSIAHNCHRFESLAEALRREWADC